MARLYGRARRGQRATGAVPKNYGESVTLIGAIDEQDAFGLVEVTGKKLADATASGKPGTLEIIEAEIYAPLTVSKR